MGGVFGDREATLNRFKENYTTLLSDDIKARLVLENDDMCWNVHELLPVCKELNIPLVLDWHHHNIVRVPEMREGTLDILQLMPEIKETWIRKGITQKQHYSEAKYPDGSANKRRRHSPRVQALPPCEPTMDLMIEAKDKEQAVFELMKIFKLDGWDRFAEVLPHIREDENKPEPKRKKAAPKKPAKKRGKRAEGEADTNVQDGEEGGSEAGIEENGEPAVPVVPDNELGMGGSERRVYWPEGMEHWLSPPKRIRKKKEEAVGEGNSEVVDDDEKDLNGDVDGDSSKKTMRKGSTEVVTEGLPEEVQPSTLGGRKKEKIKAEELAVVELPDPAKGSRGRRSGRARKVVVSYADES